MVNVPTPIIDKNGRATTVHKRLGGSATVSPKLTSVAPKLKKQTATSKVDERFIFTFDKDFAATPNGAKLNSMYPDRAIDRGDMRKKSAAEVTSREVYELASHGFTVRDSIVFAHFGMSAEESEAFVKEAEAETGKPYKLTPRPWMLQMLEEDIDHRTLLSTYQNGLSQSDLDQVDPKRAVSVIKAFTYKAMNVENRVAQLVLKGEIDWEDVKTVGVTRATKSEYMVAGLLRNNQPNRLPADQVKKVLVETEKRIRRSLSTGLTMSQGRMVDDYVLSYGVAGESMWKLHNPLLIEELRPSFKNIADEEERKAAIFNAAKYCDDVLHHARLLQGALPRIIAAGKFKDGRGLPKGTYEGQYPNQIEPDWDYLEIVKYKDFGLSVEVCVAALENGWSPNQAQGILSGSTSAPVADGWL